MPTNNDITLIFGDPEETKNTVKFTEQGDEDKHWCGKIYFKKTALAKMKPANPKTIEITVRGMK